MTSCRHCGEDLAGILRRGEALLGTCAPCARDLFAPGPPEPSILVQPLHSRERIAWRDIPGFPADETTEGDW